MRINTWEPCGWPTRLSLRRKKTASSSSPWPCFLELNAWHYLEDAVASGHMVAENSATRGLNNGALTATHNEYCAGGPNPGPPPSRLVMTPVTPGLCTIAAGLHDACEPLPDLTAACDAATAARSRGQITLQAIYGDHMIEKAETPLGNRACFPNTTAGPVGKSGPDVSAGADALAGARLTENWAAALAAESYREVVRASLGQSFGVLPDHDDLADCGRRHTRDPAYTWACGGTEGPMYQCLFAWWEGDANDEHAREIASLYGSGDGESPAFRALQLVPVPAGGEDRYPQETFYSGNSVAIAFSGYGYDGLGSHASDLNARANVSIQYLVAAPRTLAPLHLGAGAAFEFGLNGPFRPRPDINLLARYYPWSRLPRLYGGAAVDFGYVLDVKKLSAGVDALAGVNVVDDQSRISVFELRLGGDGYLGWRFGASVSVIF
jgi:hypothetical protein